MKKIIWRSLDIGPHRGVKKYEFAEEQILSPRPNSFKDLRPGQSSTHPSQDTFEVRHSDNNRITFPNGALVYEKSDDLGHDESGVLSRLDPKGQHVNLNGAFSFIELDDEGDPSIFFKMNGGRGADEEWKQSFLPEGGMTLTPADGRDNLGLPSFHLSADGGLTAQFPGDRFREPEVAEARLEGQALVARSGDYEFGIVPPVPVEWLITG